MFLNSYIENDYANIYEIIVVINTNNLYLPKHTVKPNMFFSYKTWLIIY